MSVEPQQDDLKKYKPAFDLVNGDGAGLNNEDTVKTIRLLGFNPTPEEITKVTGKAKELNPDAGINFDQFCEVTLILERTPEDEKAALAAAFKVFDKSGDGTVDRDELVKALKTKGGDMLTDDEVQDMFAQINGDGNVSYEELVTKLTA